MPPVPIPVAAPLIEGYRIIRLVGEGRAARTYLAEDDKRGGQIVLKVLKGPRAGSDPVRRGFALECAILSSIRNEHVVRIYEHRAGADPAYMAMEYLEGGTLRETMRSSVSAGRAVTLLRQAARGLAAVHRRAIVHRDVKPENLLARASGALVLTDFGVATRNTGALPAAGKLVGTLSYAAPEQAQGEPPSAAADVYSLGIVFYELLCGRRPFDGQTALEVMSQHLVAPVPSLPGKHARFQPLLDGMLAKTPCCRLADGDEVLQELQRIAPDRLGAAS